LFKKQEINKTKKGKLNNNLLTSPKNNMNDIMEPTKYSKEFILNIAKSATIAANPEILSLCDKLPELFMSAAEEPENFKKPAVALDPNEAFLPPSTPPVRPRPAPEKHVVKRKIIPKSPFTTSKYADDLSARVWYYVDEQTKVQGPFTSIEMDHWYDSGYFFYELLIRFKEHNDFIKLIDLFGKMETVIETPKLDDYHNPDFAHQRSDELNKYAGTGPIIKKKNSAEDNNMLLNEQPNLWERIANSGGGSGNKATAPGGSGSGGKEKNSALSLTNLDEAPAPVIPSSNKPGIHHTYETPKIGARVLSNNLVQHAAILTGGNSSSGGGMIQRSTIARRDDSGSGDKKNDSGEKDKNKDQHATLPTVAEVKTEQKKQQPEPEKPIHKHEETAKDTKSTQQQQAAKKITKLGDKLPKEDLKMGFGINHNNNPAPATTTVHHAKEKEEEDIKKGKLTPRSDDDDQGFSDVSKKHKKTPTAQTKKGAHGGKTKAAEQFQQIYVPKATSTTTLTTPPNTSTEPQQPLEQISTATTTKSNEPSKTELAPEYSPPNKGEESKQKTVESVKKERVNIDEDDNSNDFISVGVGKKAKDNNKKNKNDDIVTEIPLLPPSSSTASTQTSAGSAKQDPVQLKVDTKATAASAADKSKQQQAAKKKTLGTWNEEESKSRENSATIKSDNPFEFPSIEEAQKLEKISPMLKKEGGSAGLVKDYTESLKAATTTTNEKKNFDPNFPSLGVEVPVSKLATKAPSQQQQPQQTKLSEENKSSPTKINKNNNSNNDNLDNKIPIPVVKKTIESNNKKTTGANPKYVDDFPSL
jgi:hypothetical protein